MSETFGTDFEIFPFKERIENPIIKRFLFLINYRLYELF